LTNRLDSMFVPCDKNGNHQSKWMIINDLKLKDMAALTWTESLSVKVPSIDDQHKKLFELINDFYENINRRSNNENILKLIAGMRDYTCMHFINEERYMKKYNYPDYEAHHKQHEVFIRKIDDLETKVKQGYTIVSFEITGFLKDWIKNHIQTVDKRYSDFFIENGIS
jgi:hemerythrin